MLDTGLQLEPEREGVRAGMAEAKADWSAAERALASPAVQPGAVPEKLTYSSDYSYRGTPPGILRGSFAQGGLSNVWGSAMLPHQAGELAGWLVGVADLAPVDEAALRLVPLAATADALTAE